MGRPGSLFRDPQPSLRVFHALYLSVAEMAPSAHFKIGASKTNSRLMGFLYMVAVSCSPAVSAASDDFSPPTTTST